MERTQVAQTVNKAILVEVHMCYHLFHLFAGVTLALLGQDLVQLGGRNGAAAVLVEDLEGVEELVIFGISLGVRHLSHELNELCEELDDPRAHVALLVPGSIQEYKYR